MASANCKGLCGRFPHSRNSSKRANYMTHNFCPSCGVRGMWFPKGVQNKNNGGAAICVCCRARLRTGERGRGKRVLAFNMAARDVFRNTIKE